MTGRPEREPLARVVERKDAILFDLFHTLTALESTGSRALGTSEMLGVSREAWNEQLLERSRDRLTGALKDPVVIVRTMAHAIDPRIPEELIATAVKSRMERFAGSLLNPPESTIKTLAALKGLGMKIGLISNADVLEAAAWDGSPMASYFDSVIFSCRVGCVKPEPEIYRHSLKELGMTPGQCLFVGDGGSHELEGARNIGISTVMVAGTVRQIWPDSINAREVHADYVIEHLIELVQNLGEGK